MKNMVSSSNFNAKDLIFGNDRQLIRALIEEPTIIQWENEVGETLLHHSVFYGDVGKYYILIGFGADIWRVTRDGNTILHYASYSDKDDYLMIDIIKGGLCPLKANFMGETSIHYASNERKAHYFYLWCMRNNINLLEIKDNKGYNVNDMSRILQKNSSLYWDMVVPTTINGTYASDTKQFCT